MCALRNSHTVKVVAFQMEALFTLASQFILMIPVHVLGLKFVMFSGLSHLSVPDAHDIQSLLAP